MPRLQDALERVSPRAVLLFALLLRLAYALKLGSRFYQIDELGYDTAARIVAETGSLPGIAPPIPVAFFAFFYGLLGGDMLWPRLGQAFAGTLLVWLVGLMTEEVTKSKPAARLALLLSAVYPFFVYYGGVLLSETLYLVFLTAAFWQLASGAQPAFGLLLGLAALCRVEAAFIAPLVLITIPRKKLLPAALAFAVPLLFWMSRNKLATGAFTLDNHGGMTLIHGTMHHDLAQEKDTADVMKQAATEPWFIEAQARPEHERDALYRKAAVDWMKANPKATARGWLDKFLLFWRFYPRTDKVYHQTEHSRPDVGLSRSVLVAVSLLFEPALILLGLYGLWKLRAWPIWGFIAGTCGIHVLVVSMMRYRLPVMPFLIMGASFVLSEALSRRSGSAR